MNRTRLVDLGPGPVAFLGHRADVTRLRVEIPPDYVNGDGSRVAEVELALAVPDPGPGLTTLVAALLELQPWRAVKVLGDRSVGLDDRHSAGQACWISSSGGFALLRAALDQGFDIAIPAATAERVLPLGTAAPWATHPVAGCSGTPHVVLLVEAGRR